MKTDEQRGKLGVWLYRGRQARGWSAEEAPARIFEATGYRVGRTHLSNLENGNRHNLSPDLQAALEAVYGPPGEGVVPRRQTQEERLAAAVYGAVRRAVEELVAEGRLVVREPRRRR